MGKALTVARGLDEPGTAAMLLAPFQIEMLTHTHAALLAQRVRSVAHGVRSRVSVGCWPPPGRPTESVLGVVARHCAAWLESRLAQSARATDDWSMEMPEGCHCELCRTLAAFLVDKARRWFEWPLAEQRRRPVHSSDRWDRTAGEPSDPAQRGPYTLVLSKTDALFACEREARRRDQADLSWLGRAFAAG